MSGVDTINNSVPPLVTLNAIAALTNGVAMDNRACRTNHCVVAVSSAGVTAGNVQMQGSLDGVSWFNMGAVVNINAASTVFQFAVTGTPARYVRANVSLAITGGTVTATVGSA